MNVYIDVCMNVCMDVWMYVQQTQKHLWINGLSASIMEINKASQKFKRFNAMRKFMKKYESCKLKINLRDLAMRLIFFGDLSIGK